MKKYIFILFLTGVAACAGSGKTGRLITTKTDDSIVRVNSLLEITDKPYAYYVTPTGKKILLQKTVADDDDKSLVDSSADISTFNRMTALSWSAGANDEFTGSVRPTVKTSYSSQKYKTYTTIPALYSSLKSKEFMNALGIGQSDKRVSYEDRNVTVKKAYLYTITVEADNDFHLLIGNTPVYDAGVTRVFNAEIPGVPRHGGMAKKEHIRKLRAKLINTFGGIPLCGRSGYLQQYTKISISGTLFYDTHHKSNPARCRDVEGESAWEIHPVWDIKKL